MIMNTAYQVRYGTASGSITFKAVAFLIEHENLHAVSGGYSWPVADSKDGKTCQRIWFFGRETEPWIKTPAQPRRQRVRQSFPNGQLPCFWAGICIGKIGPERNGFDFKYRAICQRLCTRQPLVRPEANDAKQRRRRQRNNQNDFNSPHRISSRAAEGHRTPAVAEAMAG